MQYFYEYSTLNQVLVFITGYRVLVEQLAVVHITVTHSFRTQVYSTYIKPSLDYTTTHSKLKLDGDMKNVKSSRITWIEWARDISV